MMMLMFFYSLWSWFVWMKGILSSRNITTCVEYTLSIICLIFFYFSSHFMMMSILLSSLSFMMIRRFLWSKRGEERETDIPDVHELLSHMNETIAEWLAESNRECHDSWCNMQSQGREEEEQEVSDKRLMMNEEEGRESRSLSNY